MSVGNGPSAAEMGLNQQDVSSSPQNRSENRPSSRQRAQTAPNSSAEPSRPTGQQRDAADQSATNDGTSTREDFSDTHNDKPRITDEARELIDKVDQGGVPQYLTSNFRRILSENGITDEAINSMTPNELIDMLRAQSAPAETSGTPQEQGSENAENITTENPVTETTTTREEPVTSTETTTTPEAGPTKEKQAREIEIESTLLIYRKDNATKDLPSASDDPNLRALGMLRNFPAIQKGEPAVPFTEPLIVKQGENIYQIYGLAGQDDDNLSCYTQTGLRGDPISFSRKDIANAILLSESEKILELFDGNEKAVIEAHIKVLKADGNAEVGLQDTPNANELIKKVADSMNLPTSDDCRILVDKLHPDDQSPERIRIDNILSESNLLDPGVISEIVKGQDFTESMEAIDDLIIKLEENANRGSQRAAKELEEAKLIKRSFGELAKGSISVDKYFDKLYTDQLGPDQAATFKKALREGNLEQAIGEMVGSELGPDERELLKKRLRKGGLAAMLVIFFAYTIGKDLIK